MNLAMIHTYYPQGLNAGGLNEEGLLEGVQKVRQNAHQMAMDYMTLKEAKTVRDNREVGTQIFERDVIIDANEVKGNQKEIEEYRKKIETQENNYLNETLYPKEDHTIEWISAGVFFFGVMMVFISKNSKKSK